MTEDLRIALDDGVNLYVSKTKGGAKTPVLCIPGLTRNSADFADFADVAAASGRDVYAVTLRGRGRSDYDRNYLNYYPTTYRRDVLATLDQLGLGRAVFVGTSLGGAVTMLTADVAPQRIAAAIINDIGPELAPEGIARIAGYVGARAGETKAATCDLDEAVARIRAINDVAFPGRDQAFWEKMARATFEETGDGKWRLAYDPNIGKAMLETGPIPDLWGPLAALKEIPMLLIRGAISDLLSPAIVEKMRAVRPGFDYCEVANTGHAPMMTEPEAASAIKSFLARID